MQVSQHSNWITLKSPRRSSSPQVSRFAALSRRTVDRPLPAHCRVDGIINRRKGADAREFGIGFAIALPDRSAWNHDFMMQGGGGGNGVVAYPAGASYAGDKPALVRGFAVASTDTGHKAETGPFDFTFLRDQQAYLDFAFLANAQVAGVAKQIIVHYYAAPADHSLFAGCSTGGREGIILFSTLSQHIQRHCLRRSGHTDRLLEPHHRAVDPRRL